MIYFTQLCVVLCAVLVFGNWFEGYPQFVNNALSDKLRADENNTAVCRYRDVTNLYPPDMWLYLTGAFCYNFSASARLNFRLPLYFMSVNGLVIPYTIINNTNVLFDYTNQAYVDLISPSFVNQRFINQWMECCELAVDCCENSLNAVNVQPTEEYPCPALWDGWDCWPQTRANTTAFRTCPAHIYISEQIECELQSQKYCLANGWNQTTNYEVCATAPIYRRRHSFHVTVLAISTGLTVPAIIIFFIFMRNQKNIRNALNRNLLIAICLKNIFTIMSKEIIILNALNGGSVMNENGVGCRILSFLDSVSTTAVFTSMFVIGFYLHKTIARVFSTDLSTFWIYTILFVCSAIPSLMWAIAMGATGQPHCWVVDTTGFQWITDVYKYAVLIANLILLLDIVRVIWTKRFNLNSQQTKSAVKATLVLIPLFGLPLLITSQRSFIDEQSCLSGDIYYYVAYTVEALQGIIVALLFCYLNKEVHQEIRKSYRKFALSMNSRYGTHFRVPSQATVTLMSNVRSSINPNVNVLPQKT